MLQKPRRTASELTAAMIRARAKKAALMASKSDAVLRPVQARKGTTHTIEAVLCPNSLQRRPARPA